MLRIVKACGFAKNTDVSKGIIREQGSIRSAKLLHLNDFTLVLSIFIHYSKRNNIIF